MVEPLELVPKHALLSESDAKKVADEYGIPLERFPKMLESDSAAVKLGAKAGQLVSIRGSAPKYVSYRFVVKG